MHRRIVMFFLAAVILVVYDKTDVCIGTDAARCFIRLKHPFPFLTQERKEDASYRRVAAVVSMIYP